MRNRSIPGLKFQRQHVLHGFIVDVCSLQERIVIELNGDAHDADDRRAYDRARAGFLKAAGYHIIRVRNANAKREHLETVLREALDLN